MRARAPGKLVLSGAYAVLEGARAIVVAVDRFVHVDTKRPAEFVTAEVRAALGSESAPWFDASALRSEGRKLGLGSSAAILVASLGALELERAPELELEELRRRVFPRALRAHREAQGGGSGVDVAASVFGDVIVAKPSGEDLLVERVTLPAALHFWALASDAPATTSDMIRRVHALRASEPPRYGALMGAQREASEVAAEAIISGDANALLEALERQGAALAALGDAAGVPIVTPELRLLQAAASAHGAAVLPAGAGGGDVSWWVSRGEGPSAIEDLSLLSLGFGAEGLCPSPVHS